MNSKEGTIAYFFFILKEELSICYNVFQIGAYHIAGGYKFGVHFTFPKREMRISSVAYISSLHSFGGFIAQTRCQLYVYLHFMNSRKAYKGKIIRASLGFGFYLQHLILYLFYSLAQDQITANYNRRIATGGATPTTEENKSSITEK